MVKQIQACAHHEKCYSPVVRQLHQTVLMHRDCTYHRHQTSEEVGHNLDSDLVVHRHPCEQGTSEVCRTGCPEDPLCHAACRNLEEPFAEEVAVAALEEQLPDRLCLVVSMSFHGQYRPLEALYQ